VEDVEAEKCEALLSWTAASKDDDLLEASMLLLLALPGDRPGRKFRLERGVVSSGNPSQP
jgi:hypothetical protein